MAEKLYVRNRRPNRVILNYAGMRTVLERRGNRADSVGLPTDAARDATIGRWLRSGILEKLTAEQYHTLQSRTVDVEPTQFLKRPIVQQQRMGQGLPMIPAESDGSKSPSQLSDQTVRTGAVPGSDWAGDLMTTQEEIEQSPELFDKQKAYPSKHRE
jgi:hypothetical protein